MISAARSRTRLDDGETSMAFSFRARPFIQRLSAAWELSVHEDGREMDELNNVPLREKRKWQTLCRWACAGLGCEGSRRQLDDRQIV